MKPFGCIFSLLTLLLLSRPAFGIDVFLSETLPWAYKKTGGEPFDGISVQVAKEISKRSGIVFNIQVLPSARHMTQFKTMDKALSIAMEHNFKDADGPIVAEITRYPIVVMLKQGSKAKTYADIIVISQELGIGVLRGLTYKPLTEDKRIKIVPVNDTASGLRMVDSGRLGGMAGSQPLLVTNARLLNLKGLPGPLVIIGETSFVIRKRPNSLDAAQNKKIVDAVKDMQKDGTVDGIFEKILNAKEL